MTLPIAADDVVQSFNTWSSDWLWGLPLMVGTTIVHIIGMGFISRQILKKFPDRIEKSKHHQAVFVLAMSLMTWFAITLHGAEAAMWALAFRLLGAVPNAQLAMLYSLNAVTSYGHESINLAGHWRLMGALEALNGWLLFGLTTAFMFGTIEKLWSKRATWQ